MDVQNEKENIKELLEEAATRDYIKADADTSDALADLANDIENDMYTVVVLGEFKRGKSTFINALLKRDLLPTNVLPETATINILSYSDYSYAEVCPFEGDSYRGEGTKEFLEQFSARKDQQEIDKIKFIKIGLPADMLKNNFVIVDTPGVSDINEQRCEVTYRFVPKAHAVLFLLDADSPLKKTEQEFIEEKLLAQGVSNIIFVVNKYDDVDEEEDENYLEDVEERIREAFEGAEGGASLREPKLYPLSAKYALEGYTKGRQDLVEASGINELRAALKELVYYGDVEAAKIENYKNRFSDILNNFLQGVINQQAMLQTDIGALEQASRGLAKLIDQEGDYQDKIKEYIDSEKLKINNIIDKSLKYFVRHLKEDVVENVELYRGLDFKDYVELRISKQLKRGLEGWLTSYSRNIDTLIKKMEQGLAMEISYHFHQKVKLNAKKDSPLNYRDYEFAFNANDVSNATTHAGAIAAGGAGLMMLVGGPVFMPFISMAAFPFLQRKFLEERLAAAKAQIIPDIENQVDESVHRMHLEIRKYVDNRSDFICKNAECAYVNILNSVKQDIDTQINNKQTQRCNIDTELTRLHGITKDVGELLDFISREV